MMDFDIEIQNRSGRHRLSRRRLSQAAGKILRKLGWKKAGLSLFLVEDRKIQKLNRCYLRHNRPTDVMAFSQLEGKRLTSGPSGTPIFLGDIVISLESAKAQAVRYGHSFFYELSFLLCHGILHLMGESDATPKAALGMERCQKKILEQIGIRRWPYKKPKRSS